MSLSLTAGFEESHTFNELLILSHIKPLEKSVSEKPNNCPWLVLLALEAIVIQCVPCVWLKIEYIYIYKTIHFLEQMFIGLNQL